MEGGTKNCKEFPREWKSEIGIAAVCPKDARGCSPYKIDEFPEFPLHLTSESSPLISTTRPTFRKLSAFPLPWQEWQWNSVWTSPARYPGLESVN